MDFEQEEETTNALHRSRSHSGRPILLPAHPAGSNFPQPPTNPQNLPEDDEDDMIGEPLGYSSFFSPAARWGQEGYYGTVEQNGSSGEEDEDEEDDDDLVQIMVRSRRSSAASNNSGRDSR